MHLTSTFRSNDYSKNMGINSEWKALLLNKVVVGNGLKLSQNNTALTEPPSGYDSVSVLLAYPLAGVLIRSQVVAEVVPGGSLNYDELVVYKNEAVRPSYLVMYVSP